MTLNRKIFLDIDEYKRHCACVLVKMFTSARVSFIHNVANLPQATFMYFSLRSKTITEDINFFKFMSYSACLFYLPLSSRHLNTFHGVKSAMPIFGRHGGGSFVDCEAHPNILQRYGYDALRRHRIAWRVS